MVATCVSSLSAGWVCYAEKTHGSYILPHIDTTRSPQGIMGSLIKQLLAKANGWDPAQIYHVTVMPCYDKKLEASRDDFLVPGKSAHSIESVVVGLLCDSISIQFSNLLQLMG